MAEELTGAELEECVRRAQQGSRMAFTTLYRTFASDVARALASFAGTDRSTLDDLVQDVFLRVIDGLDGYRNSTGFRPWLFTITLNVGRNHVRRRRSFVEIVPDTADPRAPRADDLVAVTDLMRALARLPLEQQEVVALRIGGDLDHATIARLLDIPVGTARRRLHDALATLRSGLDDSTDSAQEVPTDETR